MKKKNILILVVLLATFTLFINGVSADVGNSFSGGSGGGGFSGGGSGFSGLIFLGGGGSVFGTIVFIAFVAFMIYGQIKRNSGDNGGQYYSQTNRVEVDEASAIRRIQEVDPDFSADKFKTFSSEVYLTLQEAWESKSWKSVRMFESNALFNLHQRQIQEYIDNKKTNHLDMQNVRDVKIADFRIDGNQEVLTIQLYASLLDYTTDDESGRVIEGSKTQYQHRYYRLEFIRSSGLKTNVDKDISVTNCPNCGAPTQVTSSGECEYCGSVITNGQYGWVLNKYAAW